jgi:hypothetical protein
MYVTTPHKDPLIVERKGTREHTNTFRPQHIVLV